MGDQIIAGQIEAVFGKAPEPKPVSSEDLAMVEARLEQTENMVKFLIIKIKELDERTQVQRPTAL